MFTIVFRRFPRIEEFEEICEQISEEEEIQLNDDKEIIDSTIDFFINFCWNICSVNKTLVLTNLNKILRSQLNYNHV